MSRASNPVHLVRGPLQLADAADLRAAVATSLAAAPIDDGALRRDVWMLVGTERDAGASPGQVITILTDLVDEARLTPVAAGRERLRDVIVWCVEAYFGYLGGDIVRHPAAPPKPKPRPAAAR